MSEIDHKNAGIRPAPMAEVIVMSAAVEARQLVASIAGPSAIGGKIKEALFRVALQTGLSERRVRGIWNRESRAIRAEEMDALRRAARGRAHANEADDISARLSALEARLAAIDPEFHRGEIERLGALNRRVRNLAAGE